MGANDEVRERTWMLNGPKDTLLSSRNWHFYVHFMCFPCVNCAQWSKVH